MVRLNIDDADCQFEWFQDDEDSRDDDNDGDVNVFMQIYYHFQASACIYTGTIILLMMTNP